ncbi:hypothetical protein ACG93T_17505 [Acinetobacter beijerinckii]|uniref:hypothetical protein n=1 Tax=Acinetobacter beijerinckii TaxID=262668 RepID=UPI003AF7006F
MNKDFEWLKWVGLFVIASVIGAVVYLVQNKKSETNSGSVSINKNTIDELESDAQNVNVSPSVNDKITYNQTLKFIENIEKVRLKDSNVNLEYTPDVAAHSREYNELVEKAEMIYGTMDISNNFRYCTSMASFARELWSTKYSNANTSKEYKERTQKMYLESYTQAKKDCLAEVESKTVN